MFLDRNLDEAIERVHEHDRGQLVQQIVGEVHYHEDKTPISADLTYKFITQQPNGCCKG